MGEGQVSEYILRCHRRKHGGSLGWVEVIDDEEQLHEVSRTWRVRVYEPWNVEDKVWKEVKVLWIMDMFGS